MKKIAIIQARMSSSRLPGKVLLPLKDDNTVLDFTFNRIKKSKLVDDVIVATSTDSSDDEIQIHCRDKNYKVERGSLEDVLSRYYDTAKKYKADVIIRVTADCPLVDPYLNDDLIKFFLDNQLDYAGVKQGGLALGIATEIFTFDSLEKAYLYARHSHREHVTSYIYYNHADFNCLRMMPSEVYTKTKNYRLTLDTKEDYIVIKSIFENIKSDYIDIGEIIAYFKNNPYIALINSKVVQKGVSE
ncbi:cytidylyltransferase domain-containing protein [Wukongibacter sp. M2B1]|uniref:cytidylyltransferase domain-containing protein n=1 Tax=Wukongibacter sp. M2B1 TaxID=3088895 RepID=UPI003D79729B